MSRPDGAGVRRNDPREHAPPHRDHRDVEQREAHERAVAQDLPVAAGDGLGAHLVSNRRDENRQLDEVGHRVGQEEHDEAVEAEAGAGATHRRAEAQPDVDRHPRDAARALE